MSIVVCQGISSNVSAKRKKRKKSFYHNREVCLDNLSEIFRQLVAKTIVPYESS